MYAIKKILVPIDSFENSSGLVDYARFYADKFGASLTFIHVLENPMAYDGFSVMEFEVELLKHVERNMRSFVSTLNDGGLACDGVVVSGFAPAEIVDFAETKGIDLIVIGSHRYNVFEKFILGSVAEKVAHRAHCPVVIYNGQDD